MQVYSGNAAKDTHLEVVRRHGWGRMVSAVHWRTPLVDVPWALDNGAFSAWRKGESLDIQPYVRQLDRLMSYRLPDFTVVPDIIGGGFESLRFSLSHVDAVWWDVPAYVAVQDGMTVQDLEPVLQFFDGIFVGGSAEPRRAGNDPKAPRELGVSKGWKWDTAAGWVELAHENGLKCHIGKVGTYHDLREAQRICADSVDSTSWSVNDTHWIPEAATAEPITDWAYDKRRYSRLGTMRICGELDQNDDYGLGICRYAPNHLGEHGFNYYYEAGAPPIMYDRGPEAYIDDWEPARMKKEKARAALV